MSPRGQPTMGFGVPPLPRGIKWLVAITLGASILSKLVPTVGAIGVLTPGFFWRGWVWQIFTYPFVIPDAGALIWSLLGIWPAIAGLIAAFAVTMPTARLYFSFVLPISARGLLALSVGITVLFMIMDGWVRYVPELLAFPAGALWVSSRSPRHLLLRLRVWWIDRRLRGCLLFARCMDDKAGPPTESGRGSDKYLH